MAAENKYATNTARLLDTQARSSSSLEARLAALEALVLYDGGNQPDDGFPGGGDIFPKNSLAEENSWLMRANKDTEDYPAPRGSGVLRWGSGLGDAPVWSETSVSATSLIVGFRFTMPAEEGAFGRAYRYWLPASAIGFRIEIWSVLDPTGAPDMTKLLSFVADANDVDKWVVISIGQAPILAGAIFDLALVILPASGEITFAYDWQYNRANGDPASGNINHQSGNNQDQIRVHQEDNTATDRTSDLDNIGPGSTIEITGYTWTVQSASKTGSVYTFIVDPASRAGAGTYTFTFSYYGALPIPYVYVTDQNIADPLVDGFISTTGYENIAINQNAYGVDAQLEGAIVSPDWDFRAYSSFSSGGGGGGAGAGNEQLIATVDAAGQTEIIFTIPPGFARYRIQYDSVVPLSDDTFLKLRYSTDNGSTYVATDYQWGAGSHWQLNHSYDGDFSDTDFPVSVPLGADANNLEACGEIRLFALDRRIQILVECYGNDYRDFLLHSIIGGCSVITHSQITNIRIASEPTALQLTQGTFRLYGL